MGYVDERDGRVIRYLLGPGPVGADDELSGALPGLGGLAERGGVGAEGADERLLPLGAAGRGLLRGQRGAGQDAQVALPAHGPLPHLRNGAVALPGVADQLHRRQVVIVAEHHGRQPAQVVVRHVDHLDLGHHLEEGQLVVVGAD